MSNIMFKRISIIAIGLLVSSSFASATIEQDRNLLNLLNNGLEAACSDLTSTTCSNFKNRIESVSSKIAGQEAEIPSAEELAAQTAGSTVLIVIGEANKVVGSDVALASLEELGKNPASELTNVFSIVEGDSLFKSVELMCPIATGNPDILDSSISAAVTVEGRLSSLIISELNTCAPTRIAAVAKSIITASAISAPVVLQQIQTLSPNSIDEVIAFIAEANLSEEIQQQVADVINTPSAASIGEVPSPA